MSPRVTSRPSLSPSRYQIPPLDISHLSFSRDGLDQSQPQNRPHVDPVLRRVGGPAMRLRLQSGSVGSSKYRGDYPKILANARPRFPVLRNGCHTEHSACCQAQSRSPISAFLGSAECFRHPLSGPCLFCSPDLIPISPDFGPAKSTSAFHRLCGILALQLPSAFDTLSIHV